MDSTRWELLQYPHIARHASAKQLRKFVNGLDVELLRQMIETYTAAIISRLPKEYEELSASNTLKHWQEPKRSDDEQLSVKDVQILKLLKKHCSNKRESIYGDQSKLLVSVPMEILSYCFSFLSFRELSIIQPVCLCFVNSSTKYSKLSHHHLNIDHHFVWQAMTNQVNLNSLTHFKSILITHEWNKVTMFRHMIQLIITRSQTSLQSLTVCLHRGLVGEVILHLILTTVPVFPALHTIRWKRGDSHGRSDSHNRCWSCGPWRFRIQRLSYDALVKVMRQRVPYLHHLEIMSKIYDMEGRIQSIVDCATLNSLHLTNNALLSTNVIPHILFKMQHLNDLYICVDASRSDLHPEIAKRCITNDGLDGNAKLVLSKQKINEINASIRKLSLKFTFQESESPNKTHLTDIVSYFFVHCVNIVDLTLNLSAFYSHLCHNVKWSLLFGLLMEQKARHDAQSLSKLTIVGTQDNCIFILNGLHKALIGIADPNCRNTLSNTKTFKRYILSQKKDKASISTDHISIKLLQKSIDTIAEPYSLWYNVSLISGHRSHRLNWRELTPHTKPG
eukprot:92469_1